MVTAVSHSQGIGSICRKQKGGIVYILGFKILVNCRMTFGKTALVSY